MHSSAKSAIVALIISLACLFVHAHAIGQTKNAPEDVYRADKVVLIAIDGITWEDIFAAKMPNLSKLMRHGSSGVLSQVTPGGEADTTPKAYYISISAAAKSQASMIDAFLEARRASDTAPFYPMLMERTATPPASTTYSTGWPGVSGDAFKEWKIKTAVIGNADTKSALHREILFTTVDSNGLAPAAAVGTETLKIGPSGEYISDRDALVSLFRKAYASADYIAVMHGDAYRALTEGANPEDVRAALARADEFIGAVIGIVDMRRTAVIVLSPAGPRAASEKLRKQLTPIVVAGPGVPYGLVTSPTTFTSGLACNMDVTPTVLEFLGLIAPPQSVGTPMSFIKYKGDTAAHASSINRRALDALKFLGRGMVLYGALVVLPIFVVLSFFMFPAAGNVRALRGVLGGLGIVMLIYPAACMFAPLLYEPGSAGFGAFAIYGLAMAAVIAALVSLFYHGRRLHTLCAALWVLPAVVVFDVVARAGLMRLSVFGYSIIIGKRFYGVGNEYMALFLSSVIMGTATAVEILDLRGWKASAAGTAAMLFAAVVIGFPGFGANNGGMLTALCALVVFAAVLGEFKIGIRHILTIMLAAALMVSLFIFADMNSTGKHPTHLAGFASRARTHGMSYISDMAVRKFAIQMSVLRYTKWPYAFVVVFGFLVWLFMRPGNRLREFLYGNRNIRAGVYASLTAAFAGYLLNDTGFPITVFILGASFTAVANYYMISLGANSGDKSSG